MAKDRRKGGEDSRPNNKKVERRQFDRRKHLRVPVKIWIEEFKDKDLYFHQAGNLSIGGISFERSIPHPVGTRVRLQFKLPKVKANIEVVGEVVSGPKGDELRGSVKFVELDEEKRKLIEEFVAQQEK